jgi:hypothetical protein
VRAKRKSKKSNQQSSAPMAGGAPLPPGNVGATPGGMPPG